MTFLYIAYVVGILANIIIFLVLRRDAYADTSHQFSILSEAADFKRKMIIETGESYINQFRLITEEGNQRVIEFMELHGIKRVADAQIERIIQSGDSYLEGFKQTMETMNELSIDLNRIKQAKGG